VTPDLQWLWLGLVGSAALWIGVGRARGTAVGRGLPRLVDDPRRMALLCGLPFALRLVRIGGATAPDVHPPLTLPLAAWAAWIVSLLLLATAFVFARRPPGARLALPALLPVGALLAFVLMGWADSPFDRQGLERALDEHAALAARLADEVPAAYTELREEVDGEVKSELEKARGRATALFESRGLTPAVALLDERRDALEKRTGQWRERVERHRQELELQRRQERERAEATYSSSW
jgi:hypothetical protein